MKLKRQLSSDDIGYRNIGVNINKENILKDLVDGEISKRMSFADLGKQKVSSTNVNMIICCESKLNIEKVELISCVTKIKVILHVD